MYDELIVRLRDLAVELRKAEDALLVRDAADAIEELADTNVGKWIPVTERLPEIEEDVLIAATVHTKKGDVRAVTGDFINTAGQWNGASCSWRYEVTHWMPLPTPPQEE